MRKDDNKFKGTILANMEGEKYCKNFQVFSYLSNYRARIFIGISGEYLKFSMKIIPDFTIIIESTSAL